jgi:hypothetical protein
LFYEGTISNGILEARGYVHSTGGISGAMVIVTGECISTMTDQLVNNIDTTAHRVLRDMCERIISRFENLPTTRKEVAGVNSFDPRTE